MNKQKRICVDFDGVLHANHLGWHDGSLYGQVIPGAVTFMTNLVEEGWHVIIHTVRACAREQFGVHEPGQAVEVATWLRANGIPFHEVHIGEGKPYADVYLDDKAVRFDGNWAETKNLIDKVGTSTWMDQASFATEIQEDKQVKDSPKPFESFLADVSRSIEVAILDRKDLSPAAIAEWAKLCRTRLATALKVPADKVTVSIACDNSVNAAWVRCHITAVNDSQIPA